MSVTRYAPINIASASLALHPVHFICTTTGELPASGLKVGDTALASDTNIIYKAVNATTWVPVTAPVLTKTVAFADPTAVVATTVAVWRAPYPCTVTNLRGYRVGGTGATVLAYRGTTGTPLRSAALSLTSASSWIDGGTLQNTAFATGDTLLLAVVSVAGSVTQVSVQVEATRP